MTRGSPGVKFFMLLLINLLQLVALYNVLVGLIGTKKVNHRPTPVPEFLTHDGSRFPLDCKATADKIAIVIIDAMRVDFLHKYDMPFLNSLLEQEYGCVFLCNVKTPTVTLPRIKALVTGDISSYWDVIQNFYSTQLTQDNFLQRAKQEQNKTLAFFGDDTWTKLFPDTFDRVDGVSSFYVSDFTEVDWNVTRHLDLELKLDGSEQHSWDLLLLHYLGLDHIGHVHGLKAPALIQSKLHEMDDVIRRIFDFLRQHTLSKVSAPGLPSYLLVTGDHGMANIGGHGSNSPPEVTTPFILLSTQPLHPEQCGFLHGEKVKLGEELSLPEIEQVDVATTIALLWGLQIPSSSLGSLIPGAVNTPPEMLAALYYNTLHLRYLTNDGTNGDQDIDQALASIISRHAEMISQGGTSNSKAANANTAKLVSDYQNILSELSAKATAATVGEQNVPQMYLGFGLLVMCLVGTRLCAGRLGYSNGLLILHLLTPFVIYFSSSFVEEEHFIRHYLWATCLAAFFFGIGYSKEKELRFSRRKGLAIVSCLAAHRIASVWNSTGQKWTHLTSISDLFQPSHMAWIVFTFTFPVTVFLRTKDHPLRRGASWVFMFSLLIVMLVKYWTSTAFFGFHNETLERLAFCVIALQGITGGGWLEWWLLLTTLLHRFANIPVVTLQLLQLELLKFLIPRSKTTGQIHQILLYLWFGWTSFYYQGNSNNIASVDVSMGYIGQASYNPAIVGGLLFCNLFSAPVLQFLHFREQNSSGQELCMVSYATLMTFLTGYNSTIYTLVLILLRHHLFIWSVFAPKLLYVIGATLLNTLLIFLLVLVNICKQCVFKF